MKSAKNIIYKVLSVALLAAVWMLASCDSGFVQKTAESGNTNVTVTVSAGNARTVSPEGRILDDTDWDITFKPTGITTGADEIKSKLNWGELTEISGSFLVPPGTYTVSVHSTPSGWTGQTDNVVVTASGSVPVTVFVRREHTGTGTFSYTLTCLDYAPPAPDELTAELQPVDGGTSVGLELTLPEASSDYIFRATEVPAGYYQLSVVYTNPNNTNEQTELVKYKLDSLIEIIGGLETTGTGEFSISPEPPRTYYAVMEESAADYIIGSGIFEYYPAMFDTLMRDNTDVSKYINVLDAEPVFRKEYIAHLADGKTVDVYRYIDGGYYLVTENGVTISCDAFIADGAAGDEIPVSWQEVGPGDFSLEVNGGVAVSVTGDIFPLGTVTVTVDNPELYTSTPFLKFSQPEFAPPVTQFTTPPGSGYYVVSGGDPDTYVLADATTSPAVLWTGTDSKNIYVVPQSGISETMVLPEAISISDSSKRGFCFDDRLNLYVASDSGVTRYDQSNGTYSENNSLTILSDQTVTGVAFDTATNILWVLTYSDSTYTLKGYDNPAGYAVDATTSVAYDYSGTYSGSGAEISSFTVHNGTVYLAMRELTEQVSLIHNIYTAACPVSNELAEISLSKGIGDLAAAAGISGISDNAVISDMSVVDGALYVLFREVSPYNENLFTNFSNSTDNYSRGGVIKLNITGNVSVDKTFGTGGILGWTTESAGTVSEGAYNCYWPAPGSTDRFYGPSRFIAVAPKKLVIADDGGYYEDGGVIQKNRVVTVDLSGSQPGMTVKEPNTVVEFDDTLSASGFGSFTPTGN